MMLFHRSFKKKKPFVGDRHKYRDRQIQIHATKRQGMARERREKVRVQTGAQCWLNGSERMGLLLPFLKDASELFVTELITNTFKLTVYITKKY